MSVPQNVLDQVRYDQSVGARNTPSTGPMRSAQNLLNSWLGRTKPVPTPAAAQVARDQAAGARAVKAYTQSKGPNLLQRLNPLATQTTQAAGARGLLGTTLSALGTGLSVAGQTSYYTPLIYGALSATGDALRTDRGRAFREATQRGDYGQALRHLTGIYDRTPGLTPVLPDESGPNPFLKQDAGDGDNSRETPIDTPDPAATDAVAPASDRETAQEAYKRHLAEQGDTEKGREKARELARNEGLRIWAAHNKELAKRIKPGHRDYAQVQIGLGRMPFLPDEERTFKSTDEGVTNPAESAKALGIDKLYDAQVPVAAVDPQAFADNAIKNFSDTLKMDTVMPEGTTLGVADDLDEAYAKVSDPAFTEAIQRAFTSGLNLGTGSRVSTPPKRGTKPSQPFFEARTPGL